eukprot:5265088-Pyramimonas_sp.AAC.1
MKQVKEAVERTEGSSSPWPPEPDKCSSAELRGSSRSRTSSRSIDASTTEAAAKLPIKERPPEIKSAM